MKAKQYQKIDITIPSGQGHFSVQEQLRTDYKYATGLFFVCERPLTGITCGIKIDGNEVLPLGSDAKLFRWNENISRNEALWDFSDDMILSSEKTIDIHFDMETPLNYDFNLSIMVLLKN